MSKVLKLLNEVRKDEEGATMVEYAIMVSLIAVVSIIVVGSLGKAVSGVFSTACSSLNSASGAC